jgi:hypothetical protein
VQSNDGSDAVHRLGSEQLLTERQAADRLGLKVTTLRAWRHRGVGPPFVRLGRAIRYRPNDIENHLGTRQHTLSVPNCSPRHPQS